MASYETWTCDWHADPPEGDADFVNEDEARDRGWLVLERDEWFDVGGKPFKTAQVHHVCGDCLKDDECREWLRDGGFRGYFSDDRDLLAQVIASQESPRSQEDN